MEFDEFRSSIGSLFERDILNADPMPAISLEFLLSGVQSSTPHASIKEAIELADGFLWQHGLIFSIDIIQKKIALDAYFLCFFF